MPCLLMLIYHLPQKGIKLTIIDIYMYIYRFVASKIPPAFEGPLAIKIMAKIYHVMGWPIYYNDSTSRQIMHNLLIDIYYLSDMNRILE